MHTKQHGGRAIKMVLKKIGKTQEWLAGEIGITKQMMNIVCAAEIPPYKHLVATAKHPLVNMKVSELIALSED